VLQERKARRRCLGEWEDDCARCGDGSGLRVLCGYCHLVFHPTCLDPLTGVENWDELAELNAIEYAVKYATKTKPGDYVIDCAPPVAGGAAAAAAVAASEGGRCFTKYKECPLSAYAAAAAAVTAPLGTPGNERGSATAACTCGGTRPQRRRSRRPAAASSKAPQGGRGGRKREREGGGGRGGRPADRLPADRTPQPQPDEGETHAAAHATRLNLPGSFAGQRMRALPPPASEESA
jgi:hypothetical protein